MLLEVGVEDLKIRSRGDNRCKSAKSNKSITSIERFNKLDCITSKRLIYLIRCAIIENRCNIYRNRMCENWLPNINNYF